MGVFAKYKKPKLPDGDFFLVDDNGFEIGPLNKNTMGDNGDGEFVWSNASSSPFFLRIVAQRRGRVTTVDGGGKEFTYTIVTREQALA